MTLTLVWRKNPTTRMIKQRCVLPMDKCDFDIERGRRHELTRIENEQGEGDDASANGDETTSRRQSSGHGMKEDGDADEDDDEKEEREDDDNEEEGDEEEEEEEEDDDEEEAVSVGS